MKEITFNTSAIMQKLTMLAGVVATKNSLSILSCIRLETKDKGEGVYLELMASDNDYWLQTKAPIIEGEAGLTFCVEAKFLMQALRNLDNKNITLALDESAHVIKCSYGNGNFELPYSDTNDYPMPNEDLGDVKKKKMPAARLLALATKTEFAIAQDELRMIMNGIRFDFTPQGLVAVATDGRKLAKIVDTTNAIEEGEEKNGFVLPKKPAHTLISILSGLEGDVMVTYNERCAIFNDTSFRLCTRLIEGKYPNYDAVIPNNNNLIAQVQKEDLLSALKRVLPMSDQASELVKLSLEQDSITISSEDIDFSKKASETIPCNYKDVPFVIGFRGSVFMQLIQNIQSEYVQMAFDQPSRPCVVIEKDNDENFKYVSIIMPCIMN